MSHTAQEAADEIDRLHHALEAAKSQIVQMSQENEALRKDSERWRWIIQRVSFVRFLEHTLGLPEIAKPWEKERIDQTIDEAMKDD